MEVREIGELRYSRDHLWVRVDGNGCATIGISDYLQEKLGEIIDFNLPDEGEELVKDEAFSVIETREGRLELLTPVSGEVSEVNEELLESPELANEDPYNEGWIIRIENLLDSEFDELLTLEEYEEYLLDEEAEEEESEED
ncbi:MAG: glycine cleavage system protein GcvH [Deltaproteobacteria bacterium]|nr:glycine cleavage system protein GcvH [Deltaproteobacteria bacterium]MBW1952893.1 glycine cleavage system protein GcvH [Deltaproteobacteria bacterium]MBW1987127.1 glycine cleavage system protein GcvH [Deltaproteobacteria bacterium]MBW2135339.1 glycine cleavage system protein GcvH [Deltaproteobacteria bacterium]